MYISNFSFEVFHFYTKMEIEVNIMKVVSKSAVKLIVFTLISLAIIALILDKTALALSINLLTISLINGLWAKDYIKEKTIKRSILHSVLSLFGICFFIYSLIN